MSKNRSRVAHLQRLLRPQGKRKPPGLPPGSAVLGGEARTGGTKLELWSFDAQSLETVSLTSLANCERYLLPSKTVWLHVTGLSDVNLIAQVGQHFGLHPLMIEDVLNTHGRSKVDLIDEQVFITTRLLQLLPAASSVESDDDGLDSQHLALFVTEHAVISFCEAPTSVFEPVMARLREGKGKLRSMKSDYLLWAILDSVIDHYFIAIDHLDLHLQRMDDELQEAIKQQDISEFYRLRNDIIGLHRTLRPMREIVSSLSRSDMPPLTATTSIYFRDLYDHAVHALDQADDLRELANGLRDFYLAVSNQRMNEVMKVLACVSALFLPLTFLAGVYGMNFDHLPGKEWYWGFDSFVIACGVIVLGLVWFFKRKQWL